jgi:hypothetical protein
MSGNSLWPDLPLSAWNESCETLHRWTQIAGRVRLASTPLVNHWWNATLYVNSRGLVAPANCYASRTFDIVFDFVDHQLRIATSDGCGAAIRPESGNKSTLRGHSSTLRGDSRPPKSDQASYLNESATRVRNAVTFPSSTFMSILVTSATRM